ncbi:MAG: Gfo/Idh/MocA family oxidoreductase [Alphaproteobacteria bacterium]|nr:Gfo/Idh/MocA family oxidoreductase [Alphaproteobacteria bacterium]
MAINKKIRVAVIGAGMMGKNHLRTYSVMNGVELVGVFDINNESAKQAAQEFDCLAFDTMEEVAEKVDAVSIVTTSVSHADVGEFFLDEGIHCMMEKPLATTEEECLRLIKAAEKAGVTLMVGHIEQFNPAVIKMHDILADDKGGIHAIETRRMSAASSRILDVDVAMDLMIHDVEVVMSFINSPVVSVNAKGVKTEGYDGADYITALLQFENGATATCTASRITQNRIRTMDITADIGYLSLDFIKQDVAVYHQGGNPLARGQEIPSWADFPVEVSMEKAYVQNAPALTLELQHFLDCVNTGNQPKITGKNALDALKVIWEVQKKVGEG